MKRQFKSHRFEPQSLARIDQIDAILTEYQALGLRVTLRQLHYQLVSHHGFPNTKTSYKRQLTPLVTDARLAGLLDWDAIEDRMRPPDIPQEWNSPTGFLDDALRVYRLPRWEGQDCYCELWVEKDALINVLKQLAKRLEKSEP